MTEREITILECLKVIRDQNGNACAITTWDHQIAACVIDQVAKAVEEFFNIKGSK
jgi:hypothetical protein